MMIASTSLTRQNLYYSSGKHDILLTKPKSLIRGCFTVLVITILVLNSRTSKSMVEVKQLKHVHLDID
jgi:hypothetical protein